MTLRIELIDDLKKLSSEDIAQINRLAPHPFLCWEWMGSWLEAFAASYQPFVLIVREGNETVGVAPWCLERRTAGGRTIVFIGSGKACTDHLTLSVAPQHRHSVCETIAGWLAGSDGRTRWDMIELIGVDAVDETIAALAQSMQSVSLPFERTEGDPCYAVSLPSSWDEYIHLRSKSGRREIRQSLKSIDEGTISLVRIETTDELERYWPDFIALHQKRRDDAGTSNCFEYPHFEQFLRTAAARLLRSGHLQFLIAFAESKPICAHFAIADDHAWYFYQSGMDPEMSHLRPGLSVFCHAIRESIQSGRTVFDMMRGDEPYKLRWRAEPVATQQLRAFSPTGRAQVHKQVRQTGITFKNLVKHSLGVGTPRT
ncbi:GNAT family N-acetyltransferase [Rhodopirellula sp. MGV]|uniref:GNAT family N-acetyltransferase n=1 Tax=Rhodopirellula sp. MGV TaxID=2023130 RepID=UPI000B965EE4|nr:GNAT family N-acetyltransferase [Rhodopirellula sp. MGV]OYP36324.1 hypothetical protein CGZ80_08365 [Rhodopirellula sp. MGV]PNY38442.1 GNAT family N-acetyltransferase [Rhodopirellula baltica]